MLVVAVRQVPQSLAENAASVDEISTTERASVRLFAMISFRPPLKPLRRLQ